MLFRQTFVYQFLYYMGNYCPKDQNNFRQSSLNREINIQNSNQANVECLEQYDNPKRVVLNSNFLSGYNCSSNDLQNIRTKQKINNQASIKRRYSLIKIDSTLFDQENEHLQGFEDAIIQSIISVRKLRKTSIQTLYPDHSQVIEDLRKKNSIKQTKHNIMSERHIYQAVQVRAQKFIDVKYSDVQKYYTIMQKIGQGSYGNVVKALCKRTNQFRAIKILKKSKQHKKDKAHPQRNLQQLNILRFLDHPNIIKLYQVYNYKDCFYLVTQFCGGGSILQYLKENKLYNENIVRAIIKQLLSALSYLHQLKIAHRDIKLENVVFIKKINSGSETQDVEIKIIDFGQSLRLKFPHNNKDSKQIGTITYMAPQVISGLYSQKCDIWSCGVILWILFSGKSPFKRNSKIQTLYYIKSKQIQFVDSTWYDIPQNVKSLISQMLKKDPLKRISAKQALKNNWFTQKTSTINPVKMRQVVERLYNYYYTGNNFISIIESYLTFLKITQQQRTQITKIFKKIDKDGSGSIDIVELRQAYIVCAGEENNNIIDYVLQKMDKNKSKKIDLNEFITAYYGRKKLFHQNSLQMVFQHFDNNSDGYIDKNQLKNILKGCDQQEINAILSDIDQNGDQKITKEQFIGYIRQQRFYDF